MKNVIFILVLFLTATLPAIAQPYQSMFGRDSTEWVFKWYNLDMEDVEEAYVKKDTVIENVRYRMIDFRTPGPSAPCLIREDTLTGKVWTWTLDPFAVTEGERLAFDFSLEVGDSFDISNMQLGSSSLPYFATVDSIKYLNSLKYIYFDVEFAWAPNPSALPSEPYTIIEGIGSNMGPLWKQFAGGYDGHYLMCSYKDGARTSYENIRYGGICPEPWTVVPEIEQRSPHIIQVYPNPVQGSFSIMGLENQKILLLEIFDNTGHKVKSFSDFQKQTIEVSDLPRGLYFLKITLQNRKILHGRFTFHS